MNRIKAPGWSVQPNQPVALIENSCLAAASDRDRQTLTEFASEAFGVGTQQREILIPIDIPAIAKELRVDPDVVFGRLYYHFDHKFRYRRPDPPPNGSVVVFF